MSAPAGHEHAGADRSGPTGARPPFGAVLFDMDGVVTDTAAIHAAAWKLLFDEVLTDQPASTSEAQAPFDLAADYARYVDGRSREDGIVAFLDSRGITVPLGTEKDAPGVLTVRGLAARKNAIFLQLLEERGLRVFPGTEALLHRLQSGGVPVGLVTASRNAQALLRAAGVGDLFDVVVDGTTAHQLGLAGKPDPSMFVEAARRLGLAPQQAAVVEDAVAGVQAACRGGFGLVVGIARNASRTALETAGAHLVVEDVSQLDLGSFRADPWVLTYEGFDPAHERHREALTTLANGYLGTRGAAPESRADAVHYPGTYLAGVYNRLTSLVEGREVEHEHLVNAPNWLPFDLRIADGDGWWSTGGLTITQERRDLDLREGLLTRRVVLADSSGRHLTVVQRRLVSMARPHVAAHETTVTAEGWDPTITVRSGIDAAVTNSNVADDRELAHQHLTAVTADPVRADTVLLQADTTQSGIRIATAAHITITDPAATGRHVEPAPGHHALEYTVRLRPGLPLVIDKAVAVVTSKDAAVASPAQGALDELDRAPNGFGAIAHEHRAAWSVLWDRAAVDLRGSSIQDQLVLNLHLFHLLQTLTTHTAELDAGVPARGLHGEGYRGHVFWDELFVLPVLTAHQPTVARSLLDYRWRRLPAARDAARRAGLKGALFPWQSGSDGREETPDQLFNPRSGRWIPDNSRRQRHVGLAVAYNAWHYYQATGELDFLAQRGAELIVEVARLFASLSTYDPAQDQFHIQGVMGPDEYHDGYPDSPGSGLRDNAYTNVMTAWVCDRAVQALNLLGLDDRAALTSRIRLDDTEPAVWEAMSRRMFVPFHDQVISQFDGYDELAELDWSHYRETYGNIGRLDLILEAEGDSTNSYKLAKQADVLMLIYLLGDARLTALLERLGYPIGPTTLTDTVDYYLARTAHGSTLSRVVHASVLARLDPDRAWTQFREALVADLDDTQGGTTGEGIHLGAMAGTVDILTRSFAGMHMELHELTFDPRMPRGLEALDFRVRCHGQGVDVAMDGTRKRVVITGENCNLLINVGGVKRTLHGPGPCQITVGGSPDDH